MRNQVKSSLLLILAASASIAQASSGVASGANQSHTYMLTRVPFQGADPEKVTGWRDRALARECGWGGAFQIVPFGGRSTQSSDLGKYFAFCDKNTLRVAGSGAADFVAEPNLRDVEAIHFNIQPGGGAANTFSSIISFKPRQTFAGVGLDYKQYLHGRNACEKKWWFEVSSPVLYIRNDMRLTETVTTPISPSGAGSGDVNINMIEAFKGLKPFYNATAGLVTGSGWLYGKINGSQKKTRLGDVELRIGYDYLCEEMCHAEGYIGGLIPAGNKPKGEYVFEPIVGYGFHGGLIWGGSFGWEIWSSCDRYLHIEMDTQGRYLFENTQRRSVDVKFKPWSRYMLVYRNATEATNGIITEGINVFTPKLKVRPRFIKDINTALVYTSCGFQGEIGYNMWARSSEKIKLDRCDIFDGIAFVGLDAAGYPDVTDGVNQINRAITIKENFSASNTAYTAALALTDEDIDLGSAATPAAITHTFYGYLGYRWDSWCWPMFVGIGGSYEVSNDLGALNRWMVWGKIGVSL